MFESVLSTTDDLSEAGFQPWEDERVMWRLV